MNRVYPKRQLKTFEKNDNQTFYTNNSLIIHAIYIIEITQFIQHNTSCNISIELFLNFIKKKQEIIEGPKRDVISNFINICLNLIEMFPKNISKCYLHTSYKRHKFFTNFIHFVKTNNIEPSIILSNDIF